MKITFPDDFLWGVATSAYQIEGAYNQDGRGMSIWDTFSHTPGKTHNGDTGDEACDHYNRYLEDIANLKELGVNTYRFSFSWSRILPEGTGKVNQKGLDFYKRLVDKLLENGIKPNATLYHWDLPQTLEDKGGWVNRDVKDWFAQYASIMFREFGDIIPLWSTLNEPIAIYVGYALGAFAPGHTNEKWGKQAMHNALLAHGEGVRAFRAENLKNAKIGIVVDIWKRHPARDCEEDKALALNEDENSFRFFLNPIFKGRYSDYILEQMRRENTMPDIRPGDMELISSPIDFYGLNVYNRVVVSTDPKYINDATKKEFTGGNFLDNGVELYPKAIYDALKLLKEDYDIKIPIFITENGTYNCNEEMVDGKINDDDRILYVKSFLEWLHKAMDEGADVRGYYLWSLMDNFEWSAAYSYRFGIINIDFKTQKRTWKKSAYWYRDVIKNKGFDV